MSSSRKILLALLVCLLWPAAAGATIAFVRGAVSTSSTTAGTSKTVTISPTGGDTVLVFGFGVGVAVSNVTDNATGGSSTYTQLVAPVTNVSTASVWGTAVGGVKSGATTITVTFASSTRNTVSAVEYSGVQGFGATTTNTGSSTTPTLSITTQDNNNFVVSGLTVRSTATYTQNVGVLEVNQAGAGSTTPGEGTVDNHAASPGSVTCTVTISSSGSWAAGGIELRSIIPPCAGNPIATMGAGCR